MEQSISNNNNTQPIKYLPTGRFKLIYKALVVDGISVSDLVFECPELSLEEIHFVIEKLNSKGVVI